MTPSASSHGHRKRAWSLYPPRARLVDDVTRKCLKGGDTFQERLNKMAPGSTESPSFGFPNYYKPQISKHNLTKQHAVSLGGPLRSFNCPSSTPLRHEALCGHLDREPPCPLCTQLYAGQKRHHPIGEHWLQPWRISFLETSVSLRITIPAERKSWEKQPRAFPAEAGGRRPMGKCAR